jgi:transcriptional antiterminator RfaH
MDLEAQGFKAFLPSVLRTVRHARQFRIVRSALFPRYLFIFLDLNLDRWLSVRNAPGVSLLFTCGSRPIPVPKGVVEAFIEETDGLHAPLFGDSFCSDQKVRITSGPFADLIGTLEQLDESGRACVLIQMMGNSVPNKIHRRGLVPAL